MSGICILGAGGHGKVVLDILLEGGKSVIGFIDDDKKKSGSVINGLKVLGGWEYLQKNKYSVALGIGDNKTREKVFKKAKKLNIHVETCVHPKSIVSKSVIIGEGSVIMPGAIVNAGTVLKEGIVVNTSASVDHDCVLRKFCQIWPGAHLAGSVTVGEFSYIGTGASVVKNIEIGNNAIIGAGAAVVNDIEANTVCTGVPAKMLRKNK